MGLPPQDAAGPTNWLGSRLGQAVHAAVLQEQAGEVWTAMRQQQAHLAGVYSLRGAGQVVLHMHAMHLAMIVLHTCSISVW